MKSPPKPVCGKRLRAYLEQHATQDPTRPHLWTVHTPLKAFKKAVFRKGRGPREYCAIVNLVIPEGALINADPDIMFHPLYGGAASSRNYRKMRASRAEVHSIALRSSGDTVSTAVSKFDRFFKYRPGVEVRPTRRFDSEPETCSTGIHFFLNVRDALEY